MNKNKELVKIILVKTITNNSSNVNVRKYSILFENDSESIDITEKFVSLSTRKKVLSDNTINIHNYECQALKYIKEMIHDFYGDISIECWELKELKEKNELELKADFFKKSLISFVKKNDIFTQSQKAHMLVEISLIDFMKFCSDGKYSISWTVFNEKTGYFDIIVDLKDKQVKKDYIQYFMKWLDNEICFM